MNETVILVNEIDEAIGIAPKLGAHEKGLLHRAFSVLIFNSKGEMLLQQRALSKYHSGGLWSNACCSHPRPDEKIEEAVDRRMMEELGFSCPTQFEFKFVYKVDFENGLTEHELDHVFIGHSDELPVPNEDEIEDWKYVSMENLTNWIANDSDKFSVWFKLIMQRMNEEKAA